MVYRNRTEVLFEEKGRRMMAFYNIELING